MGANWKYKNFSVSSYLRLKKQELAKSLNGNLASSYLGRVQSVCQFAIILFDF